MAEATETTTPEGTERSARKVREGTVVSNKMDKTAVVAVVKPGRTLFELSYPNEELAKEALNKAIQKLPIKARIITREEEI